MWRELVYDSRLCVCVSLQGTEKWRDLEIYIREKQKTVWSWQERREEEELCVCVCQHVCVCVWKWVSEKGCNSCAIPRGAAESGGKENKMPPSSRWRDKKTGKKNTHRRGKDGEEEEEDTKSGRKNLRRQGECGRKRDRCFKRKGRRGRRELVMSESLRATAVCRWWEWNKIWWTKIPIFLSSSQLSFPSPFHFDSCSARAGSLSPLLPCYMWCSVKCENGCATSMCQIHIVSF